MDRYRKMYNENLLGTSDVSILKFYYASFKIQQQKGKTINVDSFLDECIKVASDTSRTFKIFGFIPYFSSKYSTEQQRISKFISLRWSDIAALFLKDDISDKEVEELLYGISVKVTMFVLDARRDGCSRPLPLGVPRAMSIWQLKKRKV